MLNDKTILITGEQVLLVKVLQKSIGTVQS